MEPGHQESGIDPIRAVMFQASDGSYLRHGLLLWIPGAALHLQLQLSLVAFGHKTQQWDPPAQELIRSSTRDHLPWENTFESLQTQGIRCSQCLENAAQGRFAVLWVVSGPLLSCLNHEGTIYSSCSKACCVC